MTRFGEGYRQGLGQEVAAQPRLPRPAQLGDVMFERENQAGAHFMVPVATDPAERRSALAEPIIPALPASVGAISLRDGVAAAARFREVGLEAQALRVEQRAGVATGHITMQDFTASLNEAVLRRLNR